MFRKFTNAAKVGTKGWLESMGGPQRNSFEEETVHSILQLLVESCVMEEMSSTTGGGRSLGSLHDERRAILRRLWDLVQDTSLEEANECSHSPFTDNQLASSEDALEKLMLAMSLLQRLWDDVSPASGQRGNNNNTMHKLLTEECLLILSILACVVAPNHEAVCGRILVVLPDANIICWLLTAVPNPDVCRMAAKLFSDLCVCDPQTMAVLLQRSQNAVDRVIAFLTRCERGESDEQSMVSRDSCSHILGALADVLAADAASLLVRDDVDNAAVSIPSMLMFGGVCDELVRILKQQPQPDTLGLQSLRIIHLILAGSNQATSLFVQMGLLAQMGQLTFRVPAPSTTTPLPPFLRATKDDNTFTTAEAMLSLAATITMDCLRTCSQLDEEQRRDLPSTSSGDTSGFMRSGASTQRWALTRSAREHVTNQSCIGRNVLRFISLCTPPLLNTPHHNTPVYPLGGTGGLVPFLTTLVEILSWLGEAGDDTLRKFSCDWISASDGVALSSELDMENGSSAFSPSMGGVPRYTAVGAIIGLIATTSSSNSNPATIPDTLRTVCCRLSGSLLQGAPDGWGPPLMECILSHPPTIPTVSRSHISQLLLQLVGASLIATSAGGAEARLDTIRPWIKDLFTPSLLGRDGWRAVLESAPCSPMALLVCSEVYVQVVRDNAGFSNTSFAEVLLGKCTVAIRTTFEGDGSHANRSTDAVVAWLLLAQISVHREVMDPEGIIKKAIDAGTLHCRYLSWGGSNPSLPNIASGRHDLRSDSQQASSPSPRRGGTLKAVMGAFASHELLTILSNEYSDEVASLLSDPLPLQAVTSYCEANSQDLSVGVWMRPANGLVQAIFRVGRGAARQGALWVPRDVWEAFHLEAKARNVPRAASPSVAVDLRAQIAALTARNHVLEESLRKHESMASTQRKRLRVLLPHFEASPIVPTQDGGPL